MLNEVLHRATFRPLLSLGSLGISRWPLLRKRFPHLAGDRREDLPIVGVVLGVDHEDELPAVGQLHLGGGVPGLAGPAGLAPERSLTRKGHKPSLQP